MDKHEAKSLASEIGKSRSTLYMRKATDSPHFDPVIADLNKHMAELDENAAYERKEEAVMQRAEEIAAEMISKKGFDVNGAHYDLGDVTEHIYDSDDDGTFHLLLAGLLDDETEASQIFMKSLLMKHAKAVAEDIAWREAG